VRPSWWRMEEVLDLYEEPYDPKRPVVCFDERPCQLIGDVRDPLPMKPGHIERFDSEYERGGVCWIFMSFEPLTGWRDLAVTERRRKREFAHWMRRLVEEHYPKAQKIRVVLDNLSTHSGAAFYESFPVELARKLARRIEFVYTPVHGSWLNMVEVEISVLVRQCLKRRLPDIERSWRGRLRLGAPSAIESVRVWIGASGRRMHASSFAASIHQ
jgi:transposase